MADPYPTFARLREEAPIYHNERYDFWALSRYADVEKALADWQTFSNIRSDILELLQSDFDMPPGVMMFQDPPMHTMLRGVMSRVFTPRRACTIAWEQISPGWKAASRSTNCSTAGRSGTWTTKASSLHPHRPSAVGRGCASYSDRPLIVSRWRRARRSAATG